MNAISIITTRVVPNIEADGWLDVEAELEIDGERSEWTFSIEIDGRDMDWECRTADIDADTGLEFDSDAWLDLQTAICDIAYASPEYQQHAAIEAEAE